MTKLKNKILDEIENNKIEPTPKSYFDWMERVKWILIGIFMVISVVFIALFLDDSLEMLSYGPGFFKGFSLFFFLPPLLWTIIIIGALYLIIKEFRKTNSGYKYSLWFTIGLGILVFLLGPIVLFRTGFSMMHSRFANAPFIKDFVYNERSWNNSDEGRLGGEVTSFTGKTIILKTRNLGIWKVNLKGDQDDIPEIKVGNRVRVFGEKTGSGTFDADRVIPWFGHGGDMMRGFQGGGRMMRGFPRGMMRQGQGFTPEPPIPGLPPIGSGSTAGTSPSGSGDTSPITGSGISK